MYFGRWTNLTLVVAAILPADIFEGETPPVRLPAGVHTTFFTGQGSLLILAVADQLIWLVSVQAVHHPDQLQASSLTPGKGQKYELKVLYSELDPAESRLIQ
jgi:hypothetical protein